MQTPLVERSYLEASERTSRTNIRALENKVASVLFRAKPNYQQASELEAVIKEIELQLDLEKQNLRNLRSKSVTAEEMEEHKKKVDSAKRRVDALESQKRTTRNVMKAKRLFEKGGRRFEDSIYVDRSEGKIKFEPIVIERTSRGRDIIERPSSYLGRISFSRATHGSGKYIPSLFEEESLKFNAEEKE